jgi:hypothetical protein
MRFLKKVKNQYGMTLVEILIATGLAGGLALVIAQLGTDTAKIQKGAKESLDMNGFYNQVEKNLLNHNSCVETVKLAGALKVGEFRSIPRVYQKHNSEAPTRVAFEVGTNKKPAPTFYIDEILVTRTAETEVEMKFTLQKTGKIKGYSSSSLSRNFKLDALFEKDNTLIKCYSQLDNAIQSAVDLATAEACKQVGGIQVEHFPKISIFTGMTGFLKCKNMDCPSDYPNVKSKASLFNGCHATCEANQGIIKSCALTETTKEQIVRDGLKNFKTVSLYKTIDSVRTASKTQCSHSNPCLAHEIESNRSCKKGSMCGVGNNWYTCTSTCTVKSGGFLTTEQTLEFDKVEKQNFSCSYCSLAGCSGCPGGWREESRTCKVGGLCGLNPRWRNCTSVCSINRYKNSEPIGKMFEMTSF